jgi:hypothetical protein
MSWYCIEGQVAHVLHFKWELRCLSQEMKKMFGETFVFVSNITVSVI